MRIEINIPLPKELLSEGNKRDHWAKKYKRDQRRNQYIMTFWTHHRIDKISTPCTVTFIRVSPRQLDFDNYVITCKGYRDFIADKIFPGKPPGFADSSPEIKWVYNQERGKPKEYGLKIFIEF